MSGHSSTGRQGGGDGLSGFWARCSSCEVAPPVFLLVSATQCEASYAVARIAGLALLQEGKRKRKKERKKEEGKKRRNNFFPEPPDHLAGPRGSPNLSSLEFWKFSLQCWEKLVSLHRSGRSRVSGALARTRGAVSEISGFRAPPKLVLRSARNRGPGRSPL